LADFTIIIGNKNYSSWSLRPWLVMKHLEIEFNEIVIPLYRPESKSEIHKHSPSGKVPLLIHGDRRVWESLAICDYLAEIFPDRTLWPVEPEARALARSVSAEMHAGFPHLRQTLPMDVRGSNLTRAVGDEVQRDIDRITEIWSECRTKFWRGGPFLFGKFSIADAMYAPVVSRFTTYTVKIDQASQNYCHTIRNLPAMREWEEAAQKEPWTLVF
jgi:glutathione S-transferase